MQVPGTGTIRVGLIAPQIMRWGLEKLIKFSPHLQLMGAAATVETARDDLAEPMDVVVIDLDEVPAMAPVVEFVSLRSERVIVLTHLRDTSPLDEVVLAGLAGIVRRADSAAVLIAAIEKVHAGELWLDRSSTGRMFVNLVRRKAAERDDPERAKIALLTARERDAITAMTADTSAPAKVIASRLCMSEHTLRNHLTSIYSKLNVTNRLDLYAYATRHELHRQPPPSASNSHS